ncbi:unnamed protein product, partial [Lymnaea stagnalis]
YYKLSEIDLKTAQAIGVHEQYLCLREAGFGHRPSSVISELTIKRFYISLMLWKLWSHNSEWDVANAFFQKRSFIQNMRSLTVANASGVFHFCKELEEFWYYQVCLEKFITNVAHCVSIDLRPLMEIPGIELGTAKRLHAAGYKSIGAVGSADVKMLVHKMKDVSEHAAQQIIAAAKVIHF